MRKKVDFTTGSNLKNILVFAIPVLFGEILQQLYNTVDSMVAGKFSGDAALAAVSVCSPTTKLVVSLFSGLSIGAGVVMSKAVGFGDKKETSKKAVTLFTAGVIFGVLISIIGVLLSVPLLEISQPRADYYAEALLYLRITFAGTWGILAYNILAAIQRAHGDSHSTFYILASTGVLNVILDYCFVRFFGWGVAGVAIATTIAEVLSAVLAFIRVKKHVSDFCFNFKILKNGMKVVWEAFSIGLSVAIQSMALFMSNMFIYRYINLFDTASVAGISAAQKLDAFASMPAGCFAGALSTAVGQNLGAANYSRIKPLFRITFILSLGMTLFLSLILFIACPFLASLFSDEEPVISTAVAMMSTLLPFYFSVSIRHTMAGAIRAYGKTLWPSVSVIFGMVVVRQVFLAIMMNTNAPDIKYLFMCYPTGWIASLIPVVLYFIFVTKKLYGFGATYVPKREGRVSR